MENINRAALVEIMRIDNDCTKKEAESAIDMFIDGIKKGLAKADKVTLIGFGTFYKQNRAAGKGRNPRTGETIDIAASVLPKFKAGQALKDACKVSD
jgi:DNA-binding protein HU-beta